MRGRQDYIIKIEQQYKKAIYVKTKNRLESWPIYLFFLGKDDMIYVSGSGPGARTGLFRISFILDH